MAAIMGRLCWRKPSKRGQTHVAETGWIVSWRSLLDLVRTNNETENKQKHKRENGGGTTIPESVAETPETEERPAGEALHLGMPLNGR